MADNKEYNIVSICDSNVVSSNVLNDFTAPLPTVLEFAEPYSLAITDVTFPNLMFNINKDSNTIGFSFYDRYTGTNASHDIIVRNKDTQEQVRLIGMIKMPVRAKHYIGIDDFSAECMSYFKKRKISYTRDETVYQAIYHKLMCISLNNILESSIEMLKSNSDEYQIAARSLIDDEVFENTGLAGIAPNPTINHFTKMTYDGFVQHMLDAVDKCSIWDTEYFEPYGLLSPECYNIWADTPGIETTQFQLKAVKDTFHRGAIRQAHIQRIHNYLSRIFRAYASQNRFSDASYKTIRNHLKSSIKFYLSGVAFIDVCNDFPVAKENTELDVVLERKLEDFYEKSELSLLPKVEIDESYCQDAIQLMKDLTDIDYNFLDLTAQGLRRLLRGVLQRVKMYFEDVSRMISYGRECAGGVTDRDGYLREVYKHQNPGFIFLNKKIKDLSVDFLGEEVKALFKRMAHSNDKLVIKKRTGYKERKGADYSQIIFEGEEIPEFFGLSGRHDFIIGRDEKFIGNVEPNMKHKNTNLFLYCEQITEQYVNNQMTNLAAVVPIPWEGKYGDPIHVSFNTPHFLKLASNRLDKLHFAITNRHGEPIKFENTNQTVVIVSVLRPTRFHII